ncbi:acetate and sugar kinases/Hsc70/actin family protein [Acaryochloris marina]|uniref:Actin-like protein N-terminal domain-containing protein n=1 Tax=Acaryochloris marina (strain MBIC 11017) TaxID=329726 RepID=A8ZNA3_ACAM1|nr:hypothetical protein [Acaryochloris marina]ABW32302.1 hypothetical protein AM1_C0375 [Acaryochloris marina MBIC11017]
MTTKIFLTVDVGASLTKAFLQIAPDGKLPIEECITQPSAVLRTTESLYEESDHDNSAHSSLLGYGGMYWQTGQIAETNLRQTNTDQHKHPEAIAKVLSIAGYAISKAGNGCEMYLDLLLPQSEEPSFAQMKRDLAKYVSKFLYGPKQLTCAPRFVNVLPESAGIVSYAKVYPSIILMFGHKDFTLTKVKDEHSGLGYIQTWAGRGSLMIQHHMNWTPSNELTGAKLIFSQGVGQKGLEKTLGEKAGPIVASLRQARDLYWVNLQHQLSSDIDVVQAKRIYVAGGGAPAWSKQLKEFFSGKMDSLGPVIRTIGQEFPEWSKSPMTYRLTDAYLVWRQSADRPETLQAPPTRKSVKTTKTTKSAKRAKAEVSNV